MNKIVYILLTHGVAVLRQVDKARCLLGNISRRGAGDASDLWYDNGYERHKMILVTL